MKHQAVVGPRATYLLNCWYLAAWSSEVPPASTLQRTLLDESVLLMRSETGEIAAIGNICPHRFASLGDGQFENGVVECPYHGLRFDMTGRCVHNPHGDGTINERARVRSYPLVERHGGLWIWPGNREAADPASVPDMSYLDHLPPEHRSSGYLHSLANYQLLCDNILDLSHVDFVHRNTLGSGGEMSRAQPKARRHGDAVKIEWSFVGKGIRGQRPAGSDADICTTVQVTWHAASVMVIRTEFHLVGAEDQKTRADAIHIMTPETHTTSHYFFEAEGDDLAMKEAVMRIFEEEDGAMLQQVQKNMGDDDFWAMEPLLLSHDGGAVLARRTLQRLIKKEKQPDLREA